MASGIICKGLDNIIQKIEQKAPANRGLYLLISVVISIVTIMVTNNYHAMTVRTVVYNPAMRTVAYTGFNNNLRPRASKCKYCYYGNY